MTFYARPSAEISPGDLFLDIPITTCLAPIKVSRKSPYTPKSEQGKQEFRRIYTLPEHEHLLPDLAIRNKHGEEVVSKTRVGMAMFLSWGSQVEADERFVAEGGRPTGRFWLAAPVHSLGDIPANHYIEDPETRERILYQDLVRQNRTTDYFYLPPLPDRPGVEYVLNFRKICPIGMQFFTDAKAQRMATLTEDSLCLLFSRLMWFFTRAEYFFKPIKCHACNTPIHIDVRFHGQNFDVDEWE